jgi:type II secretory pathway predicted ATPase ExeA
MPFPVEERALLERVNPPEHKICVARANDFLGHSGMSVFTFANNIRREYGRCGLSTMLFYLRGEYQDLDGGRNTIWMDARVWDYCNRNWPKPRDCGHSEPMLNTRGCQTITRCFEEALHEGVNSLIYGPPSSEKSFVLQNLVHHRREAGQNDAIYIESSPGISQTALLRRIARESGIFLARAWTREDFREALLTAFAARPYPPVLIFDEAQLVPVKTLEEIRILHNSTRRRDRPGCGIILAGSHNLYRDFMSPARRPHLEQWLSRLPNREQLTGMTREEVLEIAARTWGNGKRAKFTAQQEERILFNCEVADVYATDEDGGSLRDEKGQAKVRVYYSARRLLHYIRQQKKNAKAVLVKDGVA